MNEVLKQENQSVNETEKTESVDELDVGEVKKYPKGEQRQAEITDIVKTTKGDFFVGIGAIEAKGELKYGDPEDRIVVLSWQTTKGDGFRGRDQFNYPEGKAVTDRMNLGKYINRYGQPEVGQSLIVDFDAEGNPSILIG